jgi:hypothetical protein
LSDGGCDDQSSEVVRGHQRSSEVIRGHQRSSGQIVRRRLWGNGCYDQWGRGGGAQDDARLRRASAQIRTRRRHARSRHCGEIGEIDGRSMGDRWEIDGVRGGRVVPGSAPWLAPPDRSPRAVRCHARAAEGRRRSGSTRSCPRRAGGSGERPNPVPALSPPRCAAQCAPDEGRNQHPIREAIRGHPDRAVSASLALMREAISIPSERHSEVILIEQSPPRSH